MLGVFTHPEWRLRGKRPRLKLFLLRGKVLPEDATNLRIIGCNAVISELTLPWHWGLSLGGQGHLQSRTGFPLGDNPGKLPACFFRSFRSHPFQNRAHCEKVDV